MINAEYIPKEGERVEVASRLVGHCNKLLDVGCGDGVIHHFVKAKVSRIYGIDITTHQLQKAKKRNVITSQVDLDKDAFPYSDNYFDTVTCLDAIEHVKDPRHLLEEIYRVLKKRGYLILSTPNIRFLNHIFTLLFHGYFPKTSIETTEYHGGHLHFFTFNDIRQLLSEHKFLITEEHGIIGKPKRGWKGRFLQFLFGRAFVLEFRSQGILVKAIKK